LLRKRITSMVSDDLRVRKAAWLSAATKHGSETDKKDSDVAKDSPKDTSD